tara:strand:- start:495 stop:695 length:201 start_codon:yes stop_codon:yes gene_type:complete
MYSQSAKDIGDIRINDKRYLRIVFFQINKLIKRLLELILKLGMRAHAYSTGFYKSGNFLTYVNYSF